MARVIFLLIVCYAGIVLCDDSKAISAKIDLIPDVPVSERTAISVINLKASKTPQSIRYTLGNRVTGDRLVGVAKHSTNWSTPHNAQLTLNYPAPGTPGAVVTHVNVVVNQTSNQGRGYVVSGGVGQRSIGIVIEALNTLRFEYSAEIYGV